MSRTRERFTSGLLIGWQPRLIAHLAGNYTSRRLGQIGTAALMAHFIIPVAFIGGNVNSVWSDFDSYFQQGLLAIPFSLIVVFLLSALVTGVLMGAAGQGGPYPPEALSERRALAAAVSPIATVVPGALWSVCVGFNYLVDPVYGLNENGAYWPAWLASLLHVPGQPLWAAGAIALMYANWVVACRQLAREARAGRCRQCGYNLTGNISGVCPECGERI